MILKQLKLHNIRSYTDEVIDFPEGSFLLCGDIGSGKSTVLLAVEFALFGAKRKQLPSTALLRHGKREGNVELTFSLGGKSITIKRTLKKSGDTIKSDAGYVLINGIKKEGTSLELKSQMLALLGYPSGLLSKTRDVLFRYTVYTPQEEMKQILFEDKTLRLETLRQVFQIDKYKRISENTTKFLSFLRERANAIEEGIKDIAEKMSQKSEREKELLESKATITKTKPELENTKKQLAEKKQLLEKFEKDMRIINDLKKGIEVSEARIQAKVEKRTENIDRTERLQKEILVQGKKLEDFKGLEGLEEKIGAKKTEINETEKAIYTIKDVISTLQTRIMSCDDTKKKIADIDHCPLCEQDVTQDHKESVFKRQEAEKQKFMTDLAARKKEEEEAQKKLQLRKNSLDALTKKENELAVMKMVEKQIEEKKKQLSELAEEQERLKKEVGTLNTEKMEKQSLLKEIKVDEESFVVHKKELEVLQEGEKQLSVKIASYEKEAEGIQKLIAALEEEIQKKKALKKDQERILKLKNWFEEMFLKLMSIIEQHVMVSIHSQFNEYFQSWFNMLIEDETLSARLDDEFTPIVEQNGYESSVGNLSGGERTSLALAYRLSLNKVVNDLVSTIKTKNIIILDEPTDGFSSEQLDKVRDVLEQLNMKQICIVSHESKIESFVDSIIRINKHEHISRVVS